MQRNSFTFKLTESQQSALRALVETGNYEPAKVPYTIVAADAPTCRIALYTSGKLVVQGKGAEEWVTFTLEPEILKEARLGYEDVVIPELSTPHMGIDESGKGDFFGPLVIVAAGAYFFLLPLGLTNSLLGLALVHAALGAPFVLITVSATLAGLDPSLPRAAASLGAPPTVVFKKVILPLIAPGVISGGLFAFVTSFDEVVVAMFLTGPQNRTLPRQMFDGLRDNISPAILAVATLLIVVAILLLATVELLRRRNLRLRGIA